MSKIGLSIRTCIRNFIKKKIFNEFIFQEYSTDHNPADINVQMKMESGMLFYLTLVYLFQTVAMAKQGRHRNEISHDGNYILLHFVAFFHVASLLSTGVDNAKALELTNNTVFHRGRQ